MALKTKKVFRGALADYKGIAAHPEHNPHTLELVGRVWARIVAAKPWWLPEVPTRPAQSRWALAKASRLRGKCVLSKSADQQRLHAHWASLVDTLIYCAVDLFMCRYELHSYFLNETCMAVYWTEAVTSGNLRRMELAVPLKHLMGVPLFQRWPQALLPVYEIWNEDVYEKPVLHWLALVQGALVEQDDPERILRDLYLRDESLCDDLRAMVQDMFPTIK